jgi:dienelactone hydrolase
MVSEEVKYKFGDLALKGYLCHDKGVTDKRPGVIVVHAWRGLDDFAKHKAESLARMGYIAFAADMYGIEKPVETDGEAFKLMLPLFLDREEMRKRITAAYQTFAKHPLVDASRIGAIGFCFGGLTVIELLRSNVGTKGVVSFHGLLGYKLGENEAKKVPMVPGTKGSILILHGHDDPSVPAQDVAAIEEEFTKANIDWQLYAFGHTGHAFMNPIADNKAGGTFYQEQTARRAWAAMRNYFNDLFAGL